MTQDLKQLVLRWNNQWRYDFWYRQRYNVAFNSAMHRQLTQIDIKFDYMEKQLATEQQRQLEQRQLDEAEYQKTGSWLKPSKVNKTKEDELFKRITLDSIA